MIRAVGFDYLGVVAQLPARDLFAQLADITGADKTNIQEAYRRYNGALHDGRITVAQLWQSVAGDIGAADKLPQILATAEDGGLPTPDAAMLQLVDAVRAAGFKTGLLGNLSGSWKQLMQQQGIPGHFDVCLASSDIGVAKPDPRAFQALAVRLGVATNQLIFIDDRPTSLSGVESIGITPIVYTDLPSLKRQLQDYGMNI